MANAAWENVKVSLLASWASLSPVARAMLVGFLFGFAIGSLMVGAWLS